MKARIRKTGEIVEVICYNGFHVRSHIDSVSYIDSNGDEHDRESLNYYWDFEPMDTSEDTSMDVHWQDVRERAAIAAMQGTITLLGSSDRYAFREVVVEGYNGGEKTYPKEIAQFAAACADALIEELKKRN